MKLKFPILLIILFVFNLRIQCQNNINNSWKAQVEQMLYEFLQCGSEISPTTPCNEFTAKALEKIFNITDFTKEKGEYLSADQIKLLTLEKIDADKDIQFSIN